MRSPKGSVKRIAGWVTRIPGEVARGNAFRLCTKGLAELTVVAQWPGEHRDNATTLAESVLQAAEDDCDGRGSETHYELQLVEDGERVTATTVLRMKPLDDDHLEGTDMNGLLRHFMKRDIAMLRHTIEAQRDVMQQSVALTKLIAHRLEKLERQRGDAFETEAEALKQLAIGAGTDEEREAKVRREEKLLSLGEEALRFMLAKNAGLLPDAAE